jgi:MHS family proline/betaine transporter-like MFS transporter
MSSSDTRTWNSERRRTMIGASAGNFAEWYDWGVYGVVATLLAAQFFPEGNETLALISVYGVFAASYLTRPLGAAVFGHIADSVGRRRALASTIVITCLSTALIGCIPTYEAIGYVAPLLLLVFRLIQSLGTGGEYSTAITFVYEHGRPGEKARAVAPLLAMTFVGFLVGSLLATALSAVLPASAYETWAWSACTCACVPRRAESSRSCRSSVRSAPRLDVVLLSWRRCVSIGAGCSCSSASSARGRSSPQHSPTTWRPSCPETMR